MTDQRPWWTAPEDDGPSGTTITAPSPLPVIPASPPSCTCEMCAPEEEDHGEEACPGPDNDTHEYRCQDCGGSLTSGEAPDGYAWDTCEHDWSCSRCDHCESDQHDCQECEAVRDCQHVYRCDQCPAVWPR